MMSIRKTWIRVLLQARGATVGERLLYEQALGRMTEKEANDVVLLLERSLEKVPDADESYVRAKDLLISKVLPSEHGPASS